VAVLIAGLIIFFASHSISIINDAWRHRVAARIGEGPWKGAYSIMSIIGVVLIIWGYGIARQTPEILYQLPHWLRHVAMVLMVPVFPLLLAAYLPGRIKTATKHPMLVGVKLWALAHLLVNGTSADVLLFGSFLAWAVIDRISLNLRAPLPTPSAAPGKHNDIIAIVGGLVLYFAFVFGLHNWLIGVAPLG
jgi:uncharacterized membrane protein